MPGVRRRKKRYMIGPLTSCEDWLSGILEALAERVSELVMQKMVGKEEIQAAAQTDASPSDIDFLSKKEVMEKFGVSALTL